MKYEIPKWGSLEWCQFVQKNSAAFDALPANTFTKEGLLPCSELILVPTDRSYTLWLREHNGISVVPNLYALAVMDYISGYPYLWDSAAIRVVSGRGIVGRAPMFGVPFHSAVDIVLRERKRSIKCEFYLPDKRDDVFYSTLLFHVNRRKESNGSMIELQVWQYCPGLPEVFYIHAESADFLEKISHLDGAIIHFSPDEVNQLFTICEKIKGEEYEKQFRLDGDISMHDMLSIISSYLPVTELVDEAFHMRD